MRKKILWVDDEIEFLRSHVEFLESRGYNVTTASGGDEAVGMIGGGDDYDVVLLDKQMPRKSGRATLESIRARRPDIPVIILSGGREDSDAALQNYDGYITKPIDRDELLQICKRVINSRGSASSGLSNRYVRYHTKNSALLNGAMSASNWISLYRSFITWDAEINARGACEGVRQMHSGFKSDCGKLFCDFVIENYAAWTRGGADAGRPFMAVDVFSRAVAPELRAGKSVIMIITSGARFDEYQAMEPELRSRFSASRSAFMSALPTTSGFCLPPLLSGRYMDEVGETGGMAGFVRAGLDLAGMEDVRAFYAKTGDGGANANSENVSGHITAAINAAKEQRAFAVVVADVNAHGAGIGAVIGPDPLSMLKDACTDACTVIFTSDHGRVSCSRESEVYEYGKVCGDSRSLFCHKASVDERKAFLLENPPHFRLPRAVWDLKCVMARENYYFTLPGAKRKPNAGAQCGGISLEEMVMPIYICRPRPAERRPAAEADNLTGKDVK